MAHGRRHLAPRIVGALAALGLAGGLLALARPADIVALVAAVHPVALAVATAAYGAVFALRGLRLRLLLPTADLPVLRAALIAGAGRSAALFLPLRTGELVLPWLLRQHAGSNLTTGLAGLLAARVLDLAALGVWGAGAVLWVAGARMPAVVVAVILLTPLLLLPTVAARGEHLSIRLLAGRGQAAQRWIEGVSRLRVALDAIRARPARLAGALATSLMIWAFVWFLTWVLLAGMGRLWPVGSVVAGSAASAVANLLPLNLVANVGTLEAGWTAAFTALGVPAADAAATGFATHALSLLINAVLGGAAWILLALVRRPGNR